MSTSSPKQPVITSVRQWVTLAVGVLLVIYGLAVGMAGTLMLGCAMTGGVPVELARPKDGA